MYQYPNKQMFHIYVIIQEDSLKLLKDSSRLIHNV